ncbi:MAG: ORF6N domain-containing protein [Candidatus Omnitrophota bacterium]|nr:ORF6N domain-containing protein [Candidatus Omnitrophota bacterium]
MPKIIATEVIATRIFDIRDRKVMLDYDLAKLYGVKAKVLNQSVKRNIERFPDNFMFQLANEEFDSLRSQIVTSNRGGRRYLPYVFTEQGVAMLSSVLNSERAIQVNILIMRAFTKLREILLTHKELAVKIDVLERKYAEHDVTIKTIFEAIKQLLEPPLIQEKKIIGFRVEK